MDWSKFDKTVDLDGINNDIKEASKNKRQYKDVPLGKYEVKINKMELKTSKKGDPMVAIQFRVLEGEHKKGLIFYNQVITQGFQIHLANELLRGLDTDVEIEFKSYSQYNDLLLDIMEAVESEGLEYVLDYGENDKGYSTFEIEDVFVTS